MLKILRSRVFRIIVILICICIIIYESIGLYRDNKEYAVADSEYDKLVSSVISEEPPAETDESESQVTYPNLYINYGLLETLNKDFTAWLYYPVLGINYPVVHENEIDEYLYLTFDGTSNKSGCLFTDMLSSSDFTGMHDMVFGHNMRNGSMFGQLKKLIQDEKKEIVTQNPYIYVYTKDAVYEYRIFSYYVTRVGSDAYSVVTNKEEYDAFLKFIESNTYYPKPADLDLSTYPSLLTLSTCSGQSGSGRRFVIHAAKTNSWEH